MRMCRCDIGRTSCEIPDTQVFYLSDSSFSFVSDSFVET